MLGHYMACLATPARNRVYKQGFYYISKQFVVILYKFVNLIRIKGRLSTFFSIYILNTNWRLFSWVSHRYVTEEPFNKIWRCQMQRKNPFDFQRVVNPVSWIMRKLVLLVYQYILLVKNETILKAFFKFVIFTLVKNIIFIITTKWYMRVLNI